MTNEIERIRAEYESRAERIPADYYSWARPVNLFFQTTLCRDMIAALAAQGRFPLDGRRVLDVGCGMGRWLLEFAQWGADSDQLCGIDLSEDRIAKARRKLPGADLRSGDASHLPWPDASFDILSQFVLFTSILDAGVKRAIARDMLRVVKPGGLILWYDFRVNNPSNKQVRGIGAAEIRSLFPGCNIQMQSVTLAPPIARRAASLSWTLASFLEAFPFLRTHYLAVITRP